MRWSRTAMLLAATGVAAMGIILGAAAAPGDDAPAYTPDGRMLFPGDYRDWLYLSSGMDMAYTEGPEPSRHLFDNVFVDRKAAAVFRRTGRWPDKTVFVLEVRSGEQNGSINKRGLFQTQTRAVEVHVRDERRFEGGWGFFSFEGSEPARPLPKTEACYSCHQDHGAVDTTFVQFYPTLLPIARAKGTIVR